MSRIPEQALRGSDPHLLEMQCGDLFRRPLAQLNLANTMDLFELSVTADCPKALRKPIENLLVRMKQEVSDLPAGEKWGQFLDELRALEPTRVPAVFRDFLSSEIQLPKRQSEPFAAEYEALLQTWSQCEPAPFELNKRSVQGQTFALKVPKKRSADPSAAPKEGRTVSDTTEEEGKPAKKKSAAPNKIPKKVADPEREAYLQSICLDRLRAKDSDGLGEHVLIAGVRHLCRDRYKATPKEITNALKQLQEKGMVRYSARRWTATGRW